MLIILISKSQHKGISPLLSRVQLWMKKE